MNQKYAPIVTKPVRVVMVVMKTSVYLAMLINTSSKDNALIPLLIKLIA